MSTKTGGGEEPYTGDPGAKAELCGELHGWLLWGLLGLCGSEGKSPESCPRVDNGLGNSGIALQSLLLFLSRLGITETWLAGLGGL